MAHILLIDDSPLARSAVQLALGREGHHRLTIVTDAASGLDRAIADAPDVIVCGYAVPGMHATDAARCLRAAGVPAPMIVLGQGTSLDESLIAADLGIMGVVSRLFAVDDLRAGIDAALSDGQRFAA
jgi:DNA-binding NarL/FixJ family response regulator